MEDGDEFYMAAFWELDSCRERGFGIGPVPWNVMVGYAQFHQLEVDVARGFVQIIKAMDAVYLQWQHDEQEAAAAERDLKKKMNDRMGNRGEEPDGR